jgi:nitroreductase
MTYTRPITELVRQRYSCRSYSNQPIQTEVRKKLADFARSLHTGPLGNRSRFELVASSDGDQSALKKLGTYGFIKGANGFIVGATNSGEMGMEDFGYQLECIVLYATDINLGTCWLGGTFTKSSFAKKISTNDDEIVPAVISVGYIAQNPRRLDALIRRGARADQRLPWDQLFFEEDLETPLSTRTADDYAEPLEMLRLAPSASNKQPWRVFKAGNRWHFYIQRTSGYKQRKTVRLFTVADLQRIDMGIAMCHFELTTIELGLGGYWESKEPGLQKSDELIEYTVTWVESVGE